LLKDTIIVTKYDVQSVCAVFEDFVETDSLNRDQCKFCHKRYGNAQIVEKKEGFLAHNKGCPVISAKKLIAA
jgi:hypothetical protein